MTARGSLSRTGPARALGAAATAVTLALAAGCGSGDDAPTATPEPTAEASPDATDGAAAESTGAPDGDGATPGDVEATTLESVDSGETRLSLDQGFLDLLGTLNVDVQPVAPATAEGSTFVFPVTGGDVRLDPAAADPFTGRLQHSGGLTLAAAGQSVTFTDLLVDADSGEVTADVNGQRVPLLAVSDAQADLARQAGQLVVSDEAATLRPEALAQLTDRLGLPALPSASLGDLEVRLPAP